MTNLQHTLTRTENAAFFFTVLGQLSSNPWVTGGFSVLASVLFLFAWNMQKDLLENEEAIGKNGTRGETK